MKTKISEKKDNCIFLREKLRNFENHYLETKEKLKVYGSKDISENSDWVLLNEKLSIYREQINNLKAKIEAIGLERDKLVVYRLLESGDEKSIILTNGETDPNQGKISRVSPLGIALNNKKIGQTVEVEIGSKKYQIKIVSVKIL